MRLLLNFHDVQELMRISGGIRHSGSFLDHLSTSDGNKCQLFDFLITFPEEMNYMWKRRSLLAVLESGHASI